MKPLVVALISLVFAAAAEAPEPTPITGEEKIQWLDMMRDYDTLSRKGADIQDKIDDTPLGKEATAIKTQIDALTKKSQDTLKHWQDSHHATGCGITRSVDWDTATCTKK
jgi:hypothetical protein